MRWSNTFIPTLRDEPAEAEVPSHKLMLRAGLIRKLASGTYSYLPLGFRSLKKVIDIVREEMDATGALEVLMPVLQPVELWEETGRLQDFGELMCRFKDRYGRINILGPTHEEVITSIVRAHLRSYRQLPFNLYQIQTKFRDEIRPRFGVIRSREFIMKDAYSFDADEEGLKRSYQVMYDAYCRIFDRCGLPFKVVEADPGLMGGDVSHEFMVPSPAGEDVLFVCASCQYAANREKAEIGTVPEKKTGTAELKTLTEVETPGQHTVQQVCSFLNVTAQDVVKTIIFLGDGRPLGALIRGDHEVNPLKLARTAGVKELNMADTQTIEKITGGPMGFSGPVGLDIPLIADLRVKDMYNFVTGANKDNMHLINVNLERDFEVHKFADIRFPTDGDRCPRCEGRLKMSNGIEVGHVFKLGTKYSAAMGCTFLDENGKRKPAVMGCYGIGINRIIAAAIETSSDECGIIWPLSIAPHQVIIISINPNQPAVMTASREVYQELRTNGVEVLWDDRDVTAGVKFMDADLIGIPVRITVGPKSVSKNSVDLKLRNELQDKSVHLSQILEAVRQALQRYEPLRRKRVESSL
jgi:prolyl-tRNA synthetase